MNSPVDQQSNHASLEPRVARLEVICDRLLEESRENRAELRAFKAEVKAEFQQVRAETKSEFQQFRAEVKAEFKEVRREFRLLFGTLLTVVTSLVTGLAGLMAHGFGWI